MSDVVIYEDGTIRKFKIVQNWGNKNEQ